MTPAVTPMMATVSAAISLNRRFIGDSLSSLVDDAALHHPADVVQTEAAVAHLVVGVELQDPLAPQMRDMPSVFDFVEKQDGALVRPELWQTRHAQGDTVERATFEV